MAGRIMQRQTFSWSASFNISFNQNTVQSLGPNQTFYFANSGWAGSSNLPDYIVQVGPAGGRDVWLCKRWLYGS